MFKRKTECPQYASIAIVFDSDKLVIDFRLNQYIYSFLLSFCAITTVTLSFLLLFFFAFFLSLVWVCSLFTFDFLNGYHQHRTMALICGLIDHHSNCFLMDENILHKQQCTPLNMDQQEATKAPLCFYSHLDCSMLYVWWFCIIEIKLRWNKL